MRLIRQATGQVIDLGSQSALAAGGEARIYAVPGQPDLLAKVYIPEGEDVGQYLSHRLFDIPGIVRTLTTMTFKAF